MQRDRNKLKNDVKNGDREYHVPLSTDVQHIYYDEYDKEVRRQKEQEEKERLQKEQDALDEAEFQKNREKSRAAEESEDPAPKA